jgi:hypothetical protein
VVKVAVGQYGRFNAIRLNTEVPVFPVRLGSGTLKSAAVHKITLTVNLKHMPGTGNFLGGAKRIKGDIH